MRNILTVVLIIFSMFFPVFAEEPQLSLSTLVTVQDVPFEQCTKIFDIDAENLYYLTIASVNANRFKIEELQSKTGYILFNAVNKDFLASVIRIDSKKSILKVTPANNVYYFPPGIVLNLFKYIDLNSSEKPIVIKVN